MNKKALRKIFLAVCVFGVMPSMTAQAADGDTEEIIYGKPFFIQDGEVLISFKNQVCKGTIGEDGSIAGLTVSKAAPETLYSIALAGDKMVMGTVKGLWCEDAQGDIHEPQGTELLTTDCVTDDFQIYDGYVYYSYLGELIRVPLTGGDEEILALNVQDYELTLQGIYYVEEDGQVQLVSFEGKEKKEIGRAEPDSHMAMGGSRILISSQKIYQLSLENQTLEEMPIEYPADPFYGILPANDYFLYETQDHGIHKYEYSSDSQIQVHMNSIPDKESRVLYKNRLYAAYNTGSIFVWNMGDYGKEEYKVEDLLIQAGPDPGDGNSTLEGYDIGAGLYSNYSDGGAFVASDCFCLYFNSQDYENGLIGWDVIDKNAIQFYYTKAKDAGYGGNLVTIRAYDWGDNGYGDIPSWKMAGTSEQKKYVAIFPTDLQYNSQDQTQVQEYQRLREFVGNIDQENPNNPFSCS